MSDIKPSQLSSVTSLENEDIFVLSKSLGSGSFSSRSINVENLLNSLVTSTRTITVAKDGVANATTIKDGVALAVALSPTQDSPVAILVMPGSYEEDNPITIPQWVTLYSEGGLYSCEVVANNDGNIFVGSGNSLLNGFTIKGLSAFSNIAYTSSTSTTGQINNLLIEDCDVGVLSDNGSIVAMNSTVLSMTKAFTCGFRVTNGGFMSVVTCEINGVLTRPTCSLTSLGLGSELYAFTCSVNNCVNGLAADQGAYIDALSCHFESCDYSIHIGSTGSSRMKIMGSIIEDSSIYDLYVESATARISYTGYIDSSKFNIVDGAEVNIVADDENQDGLLVTGKASLQGKVSIGTPGALTLGEDLQVNIGEGSSFTEDKQGNEIVEFWSYDASAASGSRFTRFASNGGTQLTAANDAIIVGCKYPFPAIRLDIDVAMVTVNYITTEYWNGSAWIDLTAELPGGGVAGYKRSDFTLRANQIFRNVETQFVECSSDLFDNGDWTADNDVLNEVPLWDAGEDFYAIRFRNNGALVTGMQFSDGKVKPHSFMFSTSGKQVNWGLYRTDRSVYVDSKLLYDDPTNPPSHVDLQMSTNITFGQLPVFLKANVESKVVTSFALPYDIDTASPVTCLVDGAVTVTDTGKDILTTMYIARVDPNNLPVIGSISEHSIDQLTTVTTNANSFVSVVQPIDISAFAPGDLFFLAVARYGTDPADTFSGDFIVGDITFNYKGKFV